MLDLDVGAIATLKMEKGDVVVMSFREKMSPEVRDHVRKTMEPHIPDGVTVVVLDNGATISVLKPDASIEY